MNKRMIRRLMTAGAALFMTVSILSPAAAASYSGRLDSVDKDEITGWAWDKDDPDSAVEVELIISGVSGPGAGGIYEVKADRNRSDLKNALGSDGHAFRFPIDWSEYDADSFYVSANVISGEERIPLEGACIYNKKDDTVQEVPADQLPAREDAAVQPETQEFVSADNGESKIGPGYDTVESPAVTETENVPAVTEEAVEEQSAVAAPETGTRGEYLGTYTVTGYCSCSICSGGSGLTYSGTVPKANHTISADLSVHPIGTKLMIDGIVYTVEDMGSGVNGNHIDIYFDTHAEAVAFGTQKRDVYAVE